MPPFDVEIQRKLREYKNATFGYRRGKDGGVESDVFEGDPPKGWSDSPAKCGNAQGADEPVPGDTPEGSGVTSLYGQYSPRKLRAEIKRRTGKKAKRGANSAVLIAMLEQLDSKSGDGE